MKPALDLPPFETIQSALRRTTEHLAGELHAPAETAPDWNAFEWSVARAVCAMHGISGLIANRTRWRGPDSWMAFLEEQRAQSLARDEHITAVLAALDGALRDARIGVVALKGSSLRPLSLYQPGERPQGDIDLLTDSATLPQLSRVLESVGYEHLHTFRRHAVFAPHAHSSGPAFGEHRANPLKIEVHTRISESLPVTPVDITARLAPRELAPGINPYRDLPALILHLALHAAGNMRTHALRLVQLRDIALLAALLDSRAWGELTRLPSSLGGPWWLAAPLALAERYHPGSLPDGVLDGLWRRSSRALRRAFDRHELTDLSWSNLRIQALPGIEWARTPLEALRFVHSRFSPTREARDELAHSVAINPSTRATGWYEVTHHRRILRWLFGRPMRVQTLVSVKASLEMDPTALLSKHS